MIGPDAVEPAQVLGRGDRDLPVTTASDAGLPADEAHFAVRFVLAQRSDDAERREQIHQPARQVVRRRGEADAPGRSRAITAEVPAQERAAQRRRHVEDEVRDALRVGFRTAESKQALPRGGRDPIDELQLCHAIDNFIQCRREAEHARHALGDLRCKGDVAVADRQPDSVSVTAGAFGDVEAQQRHEVGIDRQAWRNARIRVMLGRDLEVVTACEPFDVRFLEFFDVHEVAHCIAARTGVLRLPDAFQAARDGLHHRLGNVGIGADGAQVGVELGLRGTGFTLLPGIEGHGLFDADRVAQFAIGQAARATFVRQGLSHVARDLDTALGQLRIASMLLTHAVLEPFFHRGSAQPRVQLRAALLPE